MAQTNGTLTTPTNFFAANLIAGSNVVLVLSNGGALHINVPGPFGSGDAGGTNARQWGTLVGSNLAGIPSWWFTNANASNDIVVLANNASNALYTTSSNIASALADSRTNSSLVRQTELTAGSNALVTLMGNQTNLALANVTNYGQVSWRSNNLAEGYLGAYGGFVSTSYVDFASSIGPKQWLTLTSSICYLQTTNRAAFGRTVQLRIQPVLFYLATNRQVIFNANWHRYSGALTNLCISNKMATVRFELHDVNGEGDVCVSYEPEL